MATFIVKLRDRQTKSWGNEEEIEAESALTAAEHAAGEALQQGGSDREALRARVWETPHNRSTGLHFYVKAV